MLLAAIFLLISCGRNHEGWVRINQLGYRPGDVKVAVYMGKGSNDLRSFRVVDAVTGKVILEKEGYFKNGSDGTVHRLLQAQFHRGER